MDGFFNALSQVTGGGGGGTRETSEPPQALVDNKAAVDAPSDGNDNKEGEQVGDTPADPASETQDPEAAATKQEEDKTVTGNDTSQGDAKKKLIVYGAIRRGTDNLRQSPGNVKYTEITQARREEFQKADLAGRRKILQEIMAQFEFVEAESGKPTPQDVVKSRLRTKILPGTSQNAAGASSSPTSTRPKRGRPSVKVERGSDDDNEEPIYKSDSGDSSVEVIPTPSRRARGKGRKEPGAVDDDDDDDYKPKGGQSSKTKVKRKKQPKRTKRETTRAECDYEPQAKLNLDLVDTSDEEDEPPPLLGEEVVGRNVIVLFDVNSSRKKVPYMGIVAAYEAGLKEKQPQSGRKKKATDENTAGPKKYTKKVQRLFRVVFVDGDDMWLDLSGLKQEGRVWFQDAE